MEPKIRLYRPGDEAAVAQLAVAGFEQSIRQYYSEEGVAAFLAYIFPAAIAERQRNGCQMAVAELEGEIIGAVELRDFEHVSMLFVLPEFQCCGIARRLLTRAVTLLKKARPEVNLLTVFAAPGAVEAYRHLGFLPDGAEREESGIRFFPMKMKL